MNQPCQETDAFILMRFRDAIGHLIGKPLGAAVQLELYELGKPAMKLLQANGNSRLDSAKLLMAVFENS